MYDFLNSFKLSPYPLVLTRLAATCIAQQATWHECFSKRFSDTFDLPLLAQDMLRYLRISQWISFSIHCASPYLQAFGFWTLLESDIILLSATDSHANLTAQELQVLSDIWLQISLYIQATKVTGLDLLFAYCILHSNKSHFAYSAARSVENWLQELSPTDV